MSESAHKMRRTDREITDRNEIAAILQSIPAGHLAMNDNGTPYGVTMNYFAEVKSDVITLYFHGAKEGRKSEIWKRNPKVYFFAERDDGAKESALPNGMKTVTNLYVSAAGSGVMELVEGKDEKRRILTAIAEKFAKRVWDAPLPDAVLDRTAVWKLVLLNIAGKANPGKR